ILVASRFAQRLHSSWPRTPGRRRRSVLAGMVKPLKEGRMKVMIEQLEARRLLSAPTDVPHGAPMRIIGTVTISPPGGEVKVHENRSQPEGHGLANAAEHNDVISWEPTAG